MVLVKLQPPNHSRTKRGTKQLQLVFSGNASIFSAVMKQNCQYFNMKLLKDCLKFFVSYQPQKDYMKTMSVYWFHYKLLLQRLNDKLQ